MRRRHVLMNEQPHRLHAGLHSATLVERGLKTSAVPTPETPVPEGTGVPHGVRSAIVYAEGVRVAHFDGQPFVYFCGSRNYQVLADTVRDGDDGQYPVVGKSRISASCAMPDDGIYPVRMRVSVNGSVAVHIEKIGDQAAEEAARLVPVSA